MIQCFFFVPLCVSCLRLTLVVVMAVLDNYATEMALPGEELW